MSGAIAHLSCSAKQRQDERPISVPGAPTLWLGRGLLSGKVQSLLPKTSQAARALALRAPDAVAMCSENCLVAFDATFDALPPEPILSEP